MTTLSALIVGFEAGALSVYCYARVRSIILLRRSTAFMKLQREQMAKAWENRPKAKITRVGRIAIREDGAQELGWNAILIELNPTYAEMARRRTSQTGMILA